MKYIHYLGNTNKISDINVYLLDQYRQYRYLMMNYGVVSITVDNIC